MHEEDERDIITGFEQKTNYGRPNWDEIFSKVARFHPTTHIGVFFCGVAALSHTVSIFGLRNCIRTVYPNFIRLYVNLTADILISVVYVAGK